MKLLKSFIISAFLLFISSSLSSADNVIFSDNFNDGDVSDWTVVNNNCSSSWTTFAGRYGILISSGCNTNVKPSSFLLDSYLNSYRFQVEIAFPSSINMDRAFLFLIKDAINWYDFHIFGNTLTLEKVINGQASVLSSLNYAFETGKTYLFSIDVKDHKFYLTINDFHFPEIADPAPYLTSGTIGLRAGAGAVPNSEVWFDNVVVTGLNGATPTPTPTAIPTPSPTIVPTATPKVPIVLVPGFGGSWNYKKFFRIDENSTEWELTPTIKVYDNLINTLKQSGYEMGKDLFVFLYDWRRPLSETAGVLHNYLTDKFGSQKVNLVGHSLGGMLLNTYVQQHPSPLANKVITLGSPHQGAVEAYPAVAGGDLKRNHLDEWLVSEILLKFHQEPFETKKKTIERVVPSALEILPIFNYLRKNGSLIDYSTMHLQNPLLGSLRSTQDSIPSKTTFSTYAGNGLPTLEYLDVVEPSWDEKALGLWKDGKVIKRIENSVGDTYALKKSSIIDVSGIKNKVFNDYDHTLIVAGENSIRAILTELGIAGNPVITSVPKTNHLVFMLASPARLNIVGPSSDVYTSFDKRLVIISNPVSGIYKTEVIGEGNGEYKLSVGRGIENDFWWNDYEKQTNIGQTDVFNFSVDANSNKNEPLIDNAGEDYLKLITARLNKIKNDVKNLKLINRLLLNTKLNILISFSQNKNNKECRLLGGIKNGVLDFRFANALMNISSMEKDTYDISQYILGMSYICNQKGHTNDHRFKKLEEKIIQTDEKLKNLELGDNEKLVAVIYQRALEEFGRAKLEKSQKNLLKASMLLDYSSAFLDEALWYGTLSNY